MYFFRLQGDGQQGWGGGGYKRQFTVLFLTVFFNFLWHAVIILFPYLFIDLLRNLLFLTTCDGELFKSRHKMMNLIPLATIYENKKEISVFIIATYLCKPC